MIAVDTNILVYAHRRDSHWHEPASRLLQGLAQGKSTWAIAWHCLHEFISVVTNKRIYQPASTLDEALHQIDLWVQSPSLQLLSEQPGYWNDLKAIVKPSQVSGRKFMMRVLRHFACITGFASYGRRTAIFKNSQHSKRATRWWGESKVDEKRKW